MTSAQKDALLDPRASVITADARKVSGREFLDALGLSSPEQREERKRLLLEQCKRAIRRGDTYGWPPLLVAEAQAEIDAEVPLTEVRPDPMRRDAA